MTSLGSLIERVIAPTTVPTALAFYFRAPDDAARASYFGIDASVPDLSTREYAFRSADAVFVPLMNHRVTAQEAADAILHTGLTFDDGPAQDPSYVSRQSQATPPDSQEAPLDCRVEVPDVAPDDIHVIVDDNAAPRFTFKGYVK